MTGPVMPDNQQKIQWIKEHKNFCSALDGTVHIQNKITPYTLYVDPNVIEAIPCCTYEMNHYAGFGMDELNKDRLFGSLIDQFNDEHLPAPCIDCERQEQRGAISERIRHGLYNFNDEQWERYLEDRSVPIYEIHIKFSNFCNLSCRVCSPTESSGYSNTTGLGQGATPDISENTLAWQATLDFIQRKLQDPRYQQIRIVTKGGETFLAPGLAKLLDWLCENDYSRRVILTITTNLTVNLSEKILNQFKRFAEIELCASLDSVHDNFHYVRWPARWPKIEENLRTLYQYRVEHNNLKFFLTLNFNLNNIFYIDDIIDFWASQPLRNPNTGMYLVHGYFVFNVHNPKWLCLENLPYYIRPALIGKLETCLRHPYLTENPKSTGLRDFLHNCVDLLKAENFVSSEWLCYLERNSRFDRMTGTNIQIHNKKLFDLMTIEDQTCCTKAYAQYNQGEPLYYDRRNTKSK